MKTAQLRRIVAIFIIASDAQAASAAADEPAAEAIDEIVVTADFRGRAASEIPGSVSVLDAVEISARAIQHLEELIGYIPNLNWSGDGHRARYFQIRGVGELEQYQGAPNPSVGFLVDDIDFSGIGTIGTLFDMERVEVLRGPQGSRYGANALAGLIYLQSTLPAAERNGLVQLQVGGDDMLAAGLAFGGAVTSSERVLFRVSAHHHRSNGYHDNRFLGRDDTNGRNETTLRGRLRLQPADDWDINIAAMYADIDDGYDAFALDNSYTTLSDRPGKDAQRSLGGSLRIEWTGLEFATLTSITSTANSDIDFSFDADWGNAESWAPVTYDFITANHRDRATVSQEFRLVSNDENRLNWLAGLYALRLSEDLDSLNQGEYYDPFYDFADTLDDPLQSHYAAASVAAFAQLELAVGEQSRVSLGLRVERRSTDYSDSSGLSDDPSETMTGGELTFSHDHSLDLTSYVTLSKGYKAGGFNLGTVPEDHRHFASESLWNLEAGIKSEWFDRALRLNLAAFYNRRIDQQVRSSVQLRPGDPSSFIFITDNAANGETTGLEADFNWSPAPAWEFYASLGLLDAHFDEYHSAGVDLDGRGEAHAPNYTFAVGGAWYHDSGWFARLDMQGKDSFYFDTSNNQKSEPYSVVNARLGFAGNSWAMELWARNLFDKQYAVRGFYFGNEPPDFPDTLYTRLGDARQFGVTFDRRF
ncbi:MAG TPA: TonB-dependent receptor [Woeseiaceae bacterium]|nr:TonB-dependent receptor [Woeseiaceae bacterium]